MLVYQMVDIEIKSSQKMASESSTCFDNSQVWVKAEVLSLDEKNVQVGGMVIPLGSMGVFSHGILWSN